MMKNYPSLNKIFYSVGMLAFLLLSEIDVVPQVHFGQISIVHIAHIFNLLFFAFIMPLLTNTRNNVNSLTGDFLEWMLLFSGYIIISIIPANNRMQIIPILIIDSTYLFSGYYMQNIKKKSPKTLVFYYIVLSLIFFVYPKVIYIAGEQGSIKDWMKYVSLSPLFYKEFALVGTVFQTSIPIALTAILLYANKLKTAKNMLMATLLIFIGLNYSLADEFSPKLGYPINNSPMTYIKNNSINPVFIKSYKTNEVVLELENRTIKYDLKRFKNAAEFITLPIKIKNNDSMLKIIVKDNDKIIATSRIEINKECIRIDQDDYLIGLINRELYREQLAPELNSIKCYYTYINYDMFDCSVFPLTGLDLILTTEEDLRYLNPNREKILYNLSMLGTGLVVTDIFPPDEELNKLISNRNKLNFNLKLTTKNSNEEIKKQKLISISFMFAVYTALVFLIINLSYIIMKYKKKSAKHLPYIRGGLFFAIGLSAFFLNHRYYSEKREIINFFGYDNLTYLSIEKTEILTSGEELDVKKIGDYVSVKNKLNKPKKLNTVYYAKDEEIKLNISDFTEAEIKIYKIKKLDGSITLQEKENQYTLFNDTAHRFEWGCLTEGRWELYVGNIDPESEIIINNDNSIQDKSIKNEIMKKIKIYALQNKITLLVLFEKIQRPLFSLKKVEYIECPVWIIPLRK